LLQPRWQPHVAKPLDISVEKAANLIALVAEQNMVAAIEDLAMRRGYDPREFAFVSGGAAGGLHAAALALNLGVKQLLVPKASSVLCAYGTATGDVKFDFTRSLFAHSSEMKLEAVNRTLADLAIEGSAFLDRMHIAPERRKLEFNVDARYRGQVSQINVRLDGHQIADFRDVSGLVARFHEEHERLYSVSAPGDVVEFIAWSVTATGLNLNTRSTREAHHDVGEASIVGIRTAYIDASGEPRELRLYDAQTVRAGETIQGGSLVEGDLTTVFIPAGCSASVTEEGGLLVALDR
jgi:N-methylhydantoinase A